MKDRELHEKIQEILKNLNLKEYIESLGFKVKKSGKGYLVDPCPKCGSRSRKDDPGHFYIVPGTNTYSSFSKCCKGGDLLDYLEEVEGMEKSAAIKKAEELTGIKSDYRTITAPQKNIKTELSTNTKENIESPIIDFTGFYNELKSKDREPAIKYLESRGIKREVAEKSGVLYDTKRGSCIFPVTKSHYIYRSINGTTKGNGAGSLTDIYNKEILENDSIKEIFITESIIDGLSLDRDFISLNSVSNKEKLIEAVKGIKNKRLILSLDNDEIGSETTKYLKDELNKINVESVIFSFNREYKDINEYLQKEPTQLKKELDIKAYLKPDLVKNYLTTFANELLKNKSIGAISTGFTNLDKHLDGGFYPGLYAIGAISSLGKTTLIQQITDNIAARGEEVLFFSLEMSKFEMIGKSLSRLTFSNTKTKTEAATTRQILKIEVKPEIIKTALEKYQTIADNLSIIEGEFNTSIIDIKNKIESYIEQNNKKPVVVIDYLQILQAGTGEAGTDKQKIDYLVTELKRISRKYNIVLVVISSFNRDNYMSGVSFESFKESGAIEYTADVVFGLQLEAVKYLHTEKDITKKREIINEAKEASPRKIELVCLKNRNGKSYFLNKFVFYSKFNYFQEQ